jgi:hypothetical protein
MISWLKIRVHLNQTTLACSTRARFVLRVHTHRVSFDSELSVLLFQSLGAVRKQKLNSGKHAENVQIPMLTAQ